MMPSKKVTPFGAFLVLLLSLFLSQCSSAPPDVLAPDMILHNGKIVTVDGDFSIAEAVAIKDGHFVAVGSNSEILSLAGAPTATFDLEGKRERRRIRSAPKGVTFLEGIMAEVILGSELIESQWKGY